jgi:SpoVK/Ycf46/Vps4 family AAA+-type ATPase
MARADQVKALVRTHAEGDDERFYAIAMQVAAQAARQGHAKFAEELRDLVDQAKTRTKTESAGQQTRPVPIVRPRGELAGLLAATYPKSRLADMALDDGVRLRIERVLTEQRQRGRIREHGLAPLRKLLFIGPPGTGKTMTAAALAGELGLPLFTIQLDGLITKYLGETAAKLRLIFDAIREARAVYLFDEFDALGGERTTRNEVGEIRRVLNSFLQFLELDDSESLLVAATNHPQLLDRALIRRFDAVIEYGLPSRQVAEKVMRARLALLETSAVNWPKVSVAAKGLSHADLARACEHVAKNAILAHRRRVGTSEIIEALRERRASHRK